MRTVVIQNTAQAFKAFGVKNIPRRILDSWARVKRRSFETVENDSENNEVSEKNDDSDKNDDNEEIDDDNTDQYIDAVFN